MHRNNTPMFTDFMNGCLLYTNSSNFFQGTSVNTLCRGKALKHSREPALLHQA